MAALLSVLMIGGRSCGKTTLLAGLLDNLLNDSVSRHITASDLTESGEGQARLTDIIREAKATLANNTGKTIMLSGKSTNNISHYTVRIYIPDTPQKHLDIQFTDVSGEYYQSGHQQMLQTQEMIRQADVCLIAIDTTYMMEAINPSNPLCRPSINDRFNLVSDMHTFLTQIAEEQGEKLVLFVPMKCEKWIAENRTQEVMEQVEKLYATSIHHLKCARKVQIGILPTQTMGAIHFAEHREPMICSYSRFWGLFRRAESCAVLNEYNPPQVRMANGIVRAIKSSDRIQEDGRALLFGTTFAPYSWYTIVDGVYKPVNCDQVVLQTLHFVTLKTIRECKRAAQESGWFQRLIQKITEGLADVAAETFSFFGFNGLAEELSKFGSIPLHEMERMLGDLKEKRLLKQDATTIRIL